MAAAVTNLFPGTQCGIGPATDEGFFYDFVVPRPFVPEDLEAIEAQDERAGAPGPPLRAADDGPRGGEAFFAERGEPLKVQLIEEKTAASRTSPATPSRTDTFVDFCVGPHVPSTGRLKAFKLLSTSNAYWKGDARNQPMQRVYGTAFLSRGRPQGAPAADRGGEEARPPQAGARAGALHLPPVGARRHLLARQGHDALQHARRLHARGAVPRRLPGGEDADHLQQGALGDLGPLAALPREHVPRALVRRRGDGPQGDELPGALPRVRERDAQLQGPAAAPARADAAAPQRGLRRALGPHPRAPVLAGRRALLRDGVADRRGGRAPAAPRAARLRRLRPRLHGEAVDPPRAVHGRDRHLGPRRGGRCGRRSTLPGRPTRSTRATAPSTARRSTSTSPTRSGGSGSAPRSSSTTRCPSAST